MEKIIKYKVGDIFLDKKGNIVTITKVRADYYETLELLVGRSYQTNEIRGYRGFNELTLIHNTN